MMLYVTLLTIVFAIKGSHTDSSFHEDFPRINLNDPDLVSDLHEQTGSSQALGNEVQNAGLTESKRDLERRGKKTESKLINKWTLYKENGDPFQASIKSLCLSAHRFLRKQHLEEPDVKYKKSLAKDAERWAKHLADKGLFEHEDGVYRDFGENIYRLDNTNDFVPHPVIAALSWYAESWQPIPKGSPPKNYNYKFNPSSIYSIDTSGVGHFTQLIWDESVFIGCGAATTTFKRGIVTYTSTIIVTRYLTPGNQVKQFPKHVFPLRNGEKTLKGLKISALYPGKKECVDSVPAEMCLKWKRLQWCDRDWAINFCDCTCTRE